MQRRRQDRLLSAQVAQPHKAFAMTYMIHLNDSRSLRQSNFHLPMEHAIYESAEFTNARAVRDLVDI